MKNLAGVEDCDIYIAGELVACGIDIVDCEKSSREVAYSKIWKLDTPFGEFRFRRAWYYWCVECMVPLDIANKMYSDPVGVRDIRVAGYSGNINPDAMVKWFDDDGKPLRNISEKRVLQGLHDCWPIDIDNYSFVEDPAAVGNGFITSYHIDSIEGLKLFVDSVKVG